jgi:2-polyprenyl-3-methyl-5-hydroxy-6-metoxy-1,4-benzoquinol methylase
MQEDEMERVLKCPICGDEKRKKVYDSNISDFSSEDFNITDSQYGKTWDFYKCMNCGFYYSDPTPSSELLVKIYSAVKDPDYETEKGGREDNFNRIIKRILKIKPEKGKLLDVGAATGIFMGLARENNFEVEGIEPSKWAVDFAKKEHNINIHGTDLFSYETDKKYDIITFLDLIEHLKNPLQGLNKANSLLKDKGLLVIVTPNIESLLPKILKNRWWHFRPPHINFFTKASIKYILNKAGFEIILIKPYHWKFSLYYLISRFSTGKKICDKIKPLKRFLKFIKIKLYLFDSMEIYAKKRGN